MRRYRIVGYDAAYTIPVERRFAAIQEMLAVPEEQRGTAYWRDTLLNVLWECRRRDAVALGLWNQTNERQVTLSRRTVEPLGLFDYESDRWERYVMDERARREQLSPPAA